MSLEFLFATLSILAITVSASIIFYKKIKQAQEEYENSKDLIRIITTGFNKQISRFNTLISLFQEDASDSRKLASDALLISQEVLENSKGWKEDVNVLSERIMKTESSIEEINVKIQKLSERPVKAPSSVKLDTPIPVRGDVVLDQLTSTEMEVLLILDDMREGTVPEIREKINKTREHTARLLKKLFDRGFIDRNTSSMPYRYHLRKEMLELLQKQKTGNELQL
jgi:hypothetical protein